MKKKKTNWKKELFEFWKNGTYTNEASGIMVYTFLFVLATIIHLLFEYGQEFEDDFQIMITFTLVFLLFSLFCYILQKLKGYYLISVCFLFPYIISPHLLWLYISVAFVSVSYILDIILAIKNKSELE
jgi:hypothetical protein